MIVANQHDVGRMQSILNLLRIKQGIVAAERVAERTRGVTLPLDLTSTASIASACAELKARESDLAGFVLAGFGNLSGAAHIVKTATDTSHEGMDFF